MKKFTYITGTVFILLATSCSKQTLDNINKDRTHNSDVAAVEELPSVLVESAFNVTGTELAWYASMYAEQNAGWAGQFKDADTRTGASASSLFDNNWSIVYENLMVLKDIITKCSPTGSEADNKPLLGIAQLLTAYNLAVATDMWGQVPWTEALQGLENRQPVYDKQEDIYKNVLFKYLNDAIGNLSQPIPSNREDAFIKNDLVYAGNQSRWIKAAWSLKARYFLRMEKVVPSAVDSALNCIAQGFTSSDDAFIFNKYENTAVGENPWYQFSYDNASLAPGKTLFDLMTDRNDPRIDYYFTNFGGPLVPAPNGEAEQSDFAEIYAYSAAWDNPTAPTPLMTYHELKFIEAEALARKGQDFTEALKEAIAASFAYHGATYSSDYYDNEVATRLGGTDETKLTEILTQKYIAQYEAEALEAYNDVRRTNMITLHNPSNDLVSYGFVQRYPYPTSERTANSAHIPEVNIFQNKIWWAGGTE